MINSSNRLVRLALKDGTYLDFHRDEKNNVHICHEDQCAIIPEATGVTTIGLLGLLEQFGEIIEEKDNGG